MINKIIDPYDGLIIMLQALEQRQLHQMVYYKLLKNGNLSLINHKLIINGNIRFGHTYMICRLVSEYLYNKNTIIFVENESQVAALNIKIQQFKRNNDINSNVKIFNINNINSLRGHNPDVIIIDSYDNSFNTNNDTIQDFERDCGAIACVKRANNELFFMIGLG